MPRPEITACVSGSFRRFMDGVQEAVYALTDQGVRVLSPADPRVVAQLGDFLFVASDRLRAIRPVQNRHFAAIAASDFLWLVARGGYVGSSAAMEIGYAVALGTPVFAAEAPEDQTLSEYVQVVPGVADVINLIRSQQSVCRGSVLLDPVGVIESAHEGLDSIERALMRSDGDERDLIIAARRLEQEIIIPLK